jgi:lipopolysaccharide transport system ATP-binding protein
MASITFDQVTVDFPIYNSNTRSLKARIMQVATGGQLAADTEGRVIVRALENLSFEFKDGDRIGVLGHNGAGKSTLLRLLSGAYEPSSGTTSIHGHVGSLIDISLGTDLEATGRDNAYLRGSLLGIKRTHIDKYMDEILEFSGLGNFLDMPMRTYSTGMHLRLAFAISTLVQPEILLMDEWLSVGDEAFQSKAEKRLRNLVQSSNILVIATHSKELALDLCNRLIWLEHGRIQMDGAPHAVAQAYFDMKV